MGKMGLWGSIRMLFPREFRLSLKTISCSSILCGLVLSHTPGTALGESEGVGLSYAPSGNVVESLSYTVSETSHPKKGNYVERFKNHRQRSQLRKSDVLQFNPVRRDLLLSLLYEKTRYHSLLDEQIRYTLHRQRPLPPGVQKQLARGRVLPPGLSQQIILFPTHVNDFLGFKNHPGLRLGVLGDDVLLFNTETGLILDLLKDLL